MHPSCNECEPAIDYMSLTNAWPPQDRQEKQFINHHSRSVFDLLDVDGSNSVSADEFESYGFLFGFNRAAVRHIFKEFDVSGDQVILECW